MSGHADSGHAGYLGLGVVLCVGALLACGGGADRQRVAPWTYAIACGRHQQECYADAAGACPYGFKIKDSQRGSLLVECERPRFCLNQEECALGERCVVSKRYRGKAVCLKR